MAKEALNAVLEAEEKSAQIINDAKEKAAAMISEAKAYAAENEKTTLKDTADETEKRIARVNKECSEFTAQAAETGKNEAAAYERAVMEKVDGAVSAIIEALF